MRTQDAVPDEVTFLSQGEQQSEIPHEEIPVPMTVVTKVDSKPTHGEVPGTDAFNIRKGDAEPDKVEKKGDIPSKLDILCQCYSVND